MPTSHQIKEFPPFRLDPANMCLWRGETRLALAPKAFQVLQFLVDHAGNLVSQDQLLEALWPDTYVQPEVLRKYILEIRRVLQDPARQPRFVETIPKLGYRFIAPIQTADSPGYPSQRSPTRLVGRSAALAELDNAFRLAAAGRTQVSFITGEAGIGKTTLVDAFQAAHAGRAVFARGQCIEGFGGKESYYPVLEALGYILRGPERARLESILALHAPTWLIQFPAVLSAGRRDSLKREILGATAERMLREICEALEIFTREQPLVLLVEDLHLCDESTLDLFSAMARRRAPARLLILATYRPADAAAAGSPLKALQQDLAMHGLCRELALPPLFQSDVDEYLAAEFPSSSIAGQLSESIHRSSDGNPLFMVALLDHLRRQQLLISEEGVWKLRPAGNPGAPESLTRMLEIQMEQVAAHEQQLLRAAAVSGVRFPVWALAAMLEITEAAAEQICEALAARRQFLRRAGTQELPSGRKSALYEFKHALYREILYQNLPPAQRRQFHLQHACAAEALGPAEPLAVPLAAEHFEAAGEFARALPYLMAAAALAAGRFAHADAIQLLQHASSLLHHLPPADASARRIAILERLSDAFYAQGDMDRSAETDYEIVRLAGDRVHRLAQIHAWTRLARVLAFRDPAQCVHVCELAVDAARGWGDPLVLAHSEMLLACWRIVNAGWSPGEAAACASARERIGVLSSGVPAYYEILYAHVQCIEGDYEGACRTASAGLPRSESDSLTVFLSAHSSLAYALLHLGRWGEMLKVLAVARHAAQRNGNTPWIGIFQATEAWLRLEAGDLAGARAIASELLRTHPEDPPAQVHTMSAVIGALADLELGNTAQALADLRAAVERPRRTRFFLDWYWDAVATLGLGRACLAAGDLDGAAAALDRALAAALRSPDRALHALAWAARAQLLWRSGDDAETAEALRRAKAAIGAEGPPHAAWRVSELEAAWLSARGSHQEAERARHHAAAVIHRLAASFDPGDPLSKILLSRTPLAGN